VPPFGPQRALSIEKSPNRCKSKNLVPTLGVGTQVGRRSASRPARRRAAERPNVRYHGERGNESAERCKSKKTFFACESPCRRILSKKNEIHGWRRHHDF